MSSLFSGLAEFVRNIVALEPSNVSDYKTLYLAQVLSVVTGEDVEQVSLDGSADDIDTATLYRTIGAIRYKRENSDDNVFEDQAHRVAYPADRGNMRLPVPGELVLIMSAYSDSNTPQKKVELYTNVVTGNSAARYVSKPGALTSINKLEAPSGFISNILDSITSEVANVRFQLPLQHKPYTLTKEGNVIPTMREGDMIMEGRFGSSIRFTSTIQKADVWADNQMTNLNSSSDGDPFLIIKNSKPLEPEDPKADDSIPQLIDDLPNDDQSSIYINTSQNISLVVGSSKKMLTWAVEIERTARDGNKILSIEDPAARMQSFVEGAYDPDFRVSATANVQFSGEGFGGPADSDHSVGRELQSTFNVPTVVGGWSIENGGTQINNANQLRIHHYKAGNPPGPNFEVDSANVRSGGWSRTQTNAYMYDMVLTRVENGAKTNRPYVPSPVAGTVTGIGFYQNGQDSFIDITAADGKKYTMLHMDNFAVKKGDVVTRGQLVGRQSDQMATSYTGRNVHLHIQFPSKQVLYDFIRDLANNSFGT